ncbi:MAG TPA: paraquat-inducible protein A [Burkholderiales bacterium]|nr:paraquat-inducible protein A [Burkholderiales bacterium]
MYRTESVVACETCGLVQRAGPLGDGAVAECARCDSFLLAGSDEGRLHLTAALSLAALVMYVPANIYPILRMSAYGAYSESTVWDGTMGLLRSGEWFVGIVVLVASIVVPLLKIAGLFSLVVAARLRLGRRLRSQTRLYKIIDAIGPWAMLDVFLLAVLVALVKLNDLATVLPGPGLAAFTAMVVFTMLASSSFDPRLIWSRRDGR